MNAKEQFIQQVSILTGIRTEVIEAYAESNNVVNILHGSSMRTTKCQKKKLQALCEVMTAYDVVCEGAERVKLNSTSLAGDYCKKRLQNRKDKEVFLLISLDAQKRVIECTEIAEGTLGQAPVYIREIVKKALELNADSIIISHNHPGGTLRPSRADVEITGRIQDACKLVDIKVVDHIVVAERRYYSFVEEDLL